MKFHRVTYDAKKNEIQVEDLTDAFEALGFSMEDSAERSAKKVHVALAPLPDGAAVIGCGIREDGSYETGKDTFIIRNGSTQFEPFDRTSSYHRAFDPMACYYEGQLYVEGNNAAEPDAMYFRSTKIG